MNVKREFTTSSERADLDSDYSMCIEIFSFALDILPKNNDEVNQINSLIAWNNITCEPLELKSLKQQCNLISSYSWHSYKNHELSKLDSKSDSAYRDSNKMIPKTSINSALLKAGIVHNAIQHQSSLSNCYGGLLFLLAFGLSRSNNFHTINWTRRSSNIQQQLLQGNSLLSALSEHLQENCVPCLTQKFVMDSNLMSYQLKYSKL